MSLSRAMNNLYIKIKLNTLTQYVIHVKLIKTFLQFLNHLKNRPIIKVFYTKIILLNKNSNVDCYITSLRNIFTMIYRITFKTNINISSNNLYYTITHL